MAAPTRPETASVVTDEHIEATEKESGATRNLFDLRIIIGALFLVYGVYLAIRGVVDSAAAVEQAAGVRINLWTGLSAIAVGAGFVLWALLRPLTVEQIIEGTADSVERELGDPGPADETVTAQHPRH